MKRRLLIFTAAFCLMAHAQTTDIKEYVEPLLQTTWGQDIPYNLSCPIKTNSNGDSQHCRVGCVACAMGQVMNYHQYPEVGIGSWTDMFNSSATANFGETHYDWANMLDSYADGYTEEQTTAVSTLLYHCGVAVNMIYGLESSSTFTAFANNMVSALTRFFGYETEELQSVNRSKYTKEAWLQMIYENLSAGQPIIYSGNSATMGGHTWVVDGYDREGRVHMNWGWLGQANGYYDIDLNDTQQDFNQSQSMVIGIRKPVANGVHSDEFAVHSEADAVYDLQGRKVGSIGTQHQLPKGIYICNGKKYIVK